MGVFIAATSWPWDNQNTYETEWRDMAKAWSPSAVQADDGGELAVSGGAGLSVQVAAGAATVSGHRARLAAGTTLQIAPNGTGSTRIDRVVMRCDLVNNRADLVVLGPLPSGGTAAPGSTSTALQRTTSVWDIPLASVSIGPGASTITAGNITDERLIWSPETGLLAAVAGSAALTVLVGTNFPSGVPEGLQIATRTTVTEAIGTGAAATRSRLDRYAWDESTATAVRSGVLRWRNLDAGAALTTPHPTFPPQYAITDQGVYLRGRVYVADGFAQSHGDNFVNLSAARLPVGARPSAPVFVRAFTKGQQTKWSVPGGVPTFYSPSDSLAGDSYTPSLYRSEAPASAEDVLVIETGEICLTRWMTYNSGGATGFEFGSASAGAGDPERIWYAFDGAFFPW
jgi:hypothetical protein